MSAWDDIDEALGYDADHTDETQYCVHGTWIGSWWGPDYLCQWCEDGISVDEMHAIFARQAAYEAEQAELRHERLIAQLAGEDFGPTTRALLIDWVVNSYHPANARLVTS